MSLFQTPQPSTITIKPKIIYTASVTACVTADHKQFALLAMYHRVRALLISADDADVFTTCSVQLPYPYGDAFHTRTRKNR